jgi:hypothetical protein
MSLPVQRDPTYYTEFQGNKPEIITRMRDIWYEASSIQQNYWVEADIDVRFVAGDQQLINRVLGGFATPQSRQFTFNLSQRIINMVGGHQRRNRKVTLCNPLESASQEGSDEMADILMWAHQRANAYHILSDAFQNGALVTGMNLLNVWLDYSDDPISGDLKVENFAYNSFIMDPFFRQKDLSDCSYIWTRKWVTKDQAKMLLPGREKEIDNLATSGIRDNKFYFMPENYNYAAKNLIPYDEFHYLDERKQTVVVDIDTEESLDWTGSKEDLEKYLGTFDNLRISQVIRPTVKLAIVLADHVFYDGPNLLGIDRFPFAPVFGFYYPDIPVYSLRIQGIIRGIRDAQFLFNRRKVLELDLLESSINSGLKIKEDALVDPNDAFLSGQGRALFLKKSASMDDVQQIIPPQVPPSMMQLSQELASLIQQISGVNEELLGSAEDDKAGVLSMLRQGAGLTTLQQFFDNLDQSQKLLGQIFLEGIQKNFTIGKVQRILGRPPTMQFYSKTFGKYDVSVELGELTESQRQLQFQQLLNLREMGVPVPPSILLDVSTLQRKGELIKAIQQQEEQQQQQQQMQAQAELAKLQAEIRNLEAQADANTGLGIERASRLEENRELAIERRAKAITEINAAALNEIKAAKELDTMDIDAIERLLAIVQQIKGAQETEAAQLKPPPSTSASPSAAPKTPAAPQSSGMAA